MHVFVFLSSRGTRTDWIERLLERCRYEMETLAVRVGVEPFIVISFNMIELFCYYILKTRFQK